MQFLRAGWNVPRYYTRKVPFGSLYKYQYPLTLSPSLKLSIPTRPNTTAAVHKPPKDPIELIRESLPHRRGSTLHWDGDLDGNENGEPTPFEHLERTTTPPSKIPSKLVNLIHNCTRGTELIVLCSSIWGFPGEVNMDVIKTFLHAAHTLHVTPTVSNILLEYLINNDRTQQELKGEPSFFLTELLDLFLYRSDMQSVTNLIHLVLKNKLEVQPAFYLHFLRYCKFSRGAEYCLWLFGKLEEQSPSTLEDNSNIASLLMHILSDLKMVEEAKRVFQKVKVKDTMSWNALILNHAGIGLFEECFEFVKVMEKEGILATNTTWSIIFCGLLNHPDGNVDSAMQLFERHLRTDYASWNVLVRWLFKMGKQDEVPLYVQKMVDLNVPLQIRMWNALIEGYSDSGQTDMAEKYFKEMKDSGVKPDVITWNVLINGFLKKNQVESALKIFEEMEKSTTRPTIFTWTTLLNGLYKSSSTHFEVYLNKFKHSTVKPNVVFKTFLLKNYFKENKISEAINAFKEIEPTTLSSKTWNTLLQGLLTAEMHDLVVEYFERMQRSPCKPDIYSWNVLIHVYLKQLHFDKATELITQMKSKGIKPNVYTYNLFLYEYLQNGHVEASKGIRVLETLDIEPDVGTWNIVIGYHFKNHNKEDAMVAFHHMRSKHIDPNITTWGVVVKGLFETGGADKVDIYGLMDQCNFKPNKRLALQMIQGYEKAGLEYKFAPTISKLKYLLKSMRD